MSRPTLNPSVLLFTTDRGYVAYDPVANRLHDLNASASLLAELCDGNKTLEGIKEIVRPFLGGESDAHVDRWVEQATGAGLVGWPDTPGVCQQEPSVEELTRLAHDLMDRGLFQVAFLCWQRITQRTPDEPGVWYALGNAAYWLGRPEDARAAYSKYLDYRPRDARIRHLVIALGKGEPPSRASDACIQQIYGRMASRYNALMREELDYQAPERILDAIKSVIGNRGGLAVADLGCGSGFAGACLRGRASQMVGVDLSAEMIALARERNIYDRLEIAEITDWLARTNEQFDLIVACECLVYFGDLGAVVTAAAHRLNPAGVLALTVEQTDQHPFHLTDSGRYAHHMDHVRETAKTAGLTTAHLQEGYLRTEYATPVTGLYAVFQRDR